MNHEDLDRLLGELADQPKPSLPPGFRDDVWRQIRHRQAIQPASLLARFDWLLAALVRPQPVLAALALSLVVGLCSGFVATGLGAPGAARAMDLNVFSAHAPGLPATLLGER